MENQFQDFIQIHLNDRKVLIMCKDTLVAHYLHTAVSSEYYVKKDWEEWADRIIMNKENNLYPLISFCCRIALARTSSAI